MGDLQAAGEGVHAADVGVEQVDRLEALAADLGVEVDAAGREARPCPGCRACTGSSGRCSVGNWSVSQPSSGSPVLASIEPSAPAPMATSQLVHHLVTGEGRVVGLEVELEVGEQVVGPEEVEAGGGVGVVLVLGRLLRLGLDVERAGEADLLLVVDGHVEEPGEVVELALHVGVEQGRVALAAPPEGVARAAQVVGHLHRLLDLRGGEGEDVEVRAGRRPVHVAGVAEEVGRAPEQLDAGPRLLVLEDLDDLVEVGVALLERLALGGDVAVVEGVERGAELLEELEADLAPCVWALATEPVPSSQGRTRRARRRTGRTAGC